MATVQGSEPVYPTTFRRRPIIPPVTDPCHEPPPPLLRRGIDQFNDGEFFDQHETLEDLWREETRPVRSLYQGILQIGVAMYHLQRGNHHGVVTMIARGTRRLRPFAPVCQGVDVADLIASAARVLQAVDRLGPDRLGAFDWSLAPTVRWAEPSRRPGHPRRGSTP